jgi:hypothetical protein
MYEFDLASVGGWLTAVYHIIIGIVKLDSAMYQAVVAHPNAASLALAVLLVVGLSISIGHSVVLFVNRVERRRFFLSFTLTAITFMLGVFLLTFSIWLTVVVLFDATAVFDEVLIVVGLSFAPFIFGIFIIIPYLGHILEYALRVWALMAAWIGVFTIFDTSLFAALFSGVLGWLLFEIISNIALLQTVEQWFWRKATGKSGFVESQAAVDAFIVEIQTAVLQTGVYETEPNEGNNA